MTVSVHSRLWWGKNEEGKIKERKRKKKWNIKKRLLKNVGYKNGRKRK